MTASTSISSSAAGPRSTRRVALSACRQATRYPWDGRVTLTIEPEDAGEFAVYLRLPGWCEGPQIVRNGQLVARPEIVRGYARLAGPWRAGDTLEMDLPMPVRWMQADPRIQATRGRVALMRGPLVYCLEDADHAPGVADLVMLPGRPTRTEHRPDLLGGVTIITGAGAAAT